MEKEFDMPGFLAKNQPLWHKKVYTMWNNMWHRCYSKLDWFGCLIHPDFKYLSNYVDWVKSQPRFEEFCSTCHEITWEIDKDIKYSGSRNYYPEFMSLVTKHENIKDMHNRNKDKFSKNWIINNPMYRDDLKKIYSDRMHDNNPMNNPASRKKLCTPVIGISVDNSSIITFMSLLDAHKFGFNQNAVCQCCKKRYCKDKNLYKGYRWYYLEIIEL